MQVRAVGLTGGIEPRLVIEADGIEHKRVAVPFADRLPGPRLGLNFKIMLPAIQKKSPVAVSISLPQYGNGVGALDDFIGQRVNPNSAIGQADLLRIVLAFIR